MSQGSAAQLLTAAKAVREHAYAPYSKFKVGVALLSTAGNVYSGCNHENASYGATLCAEGAAIAAMVSAGETDIQQLLIYIDDEKCCGPCGICRQRIAEFASDSTLIYLANRKGVQHQLSMAELLPYSFNSSYLK